MVVRMNAKEQDFVNCYMLGTLAEGYQYYPGIGEESSVISPVKNSSGVVFYIKALSPDPDPITELDSKSGRSEHFYIGFDNTEMFPPDFFGMEYSFKDAKEKVEYLYNKLQGKLVLFQPILKQDTKQDGRIHKNLRIKTLEDGVDFTKDSRFIPVPKVVIPQVDFEQKMKNKEIVLFLDYNHFMGAPEFVICNNVLYFSPDWIQDPAQSSAWIQAKPEQMKKVNLDEDFFLNVVSEVSKNLVFLRTEFLQNLSKEATLLYEDSSKTKNETVTIQNNRYNSVEWIFLDTLVQNALKENLIYSPEDLYNFHVSVKTNPLTIIAGMTGTGKSQLAMLYGETLGLKINNKQGTDNLLFLPISPSYTEPSDVLGYLNPVSNLYMAAGTDLVDFLIDANNNKGKIHMVIFDEMNLSQVEHWFAPFISMLELKDGKRFLPLYSEQIRAHNGTIYPPKVPINNNVIFVGTVNMDETTKDFSDRVLDRANIITLKKNEFYQSKYKIKAAESSTSSNHIGSEDAVEIFPLTDTYRSWTYTNETWTTFSDEELKFFDCLHKTLHDADNKTGVSFRVLDRIGSYINNIPCSDLNEPLLSRESAIDFQVKQRILTKLRGSVEQYGSVIGKVVKQGDMPTESKLYDLFTSKEAQKISHFSQTLKVITKKARELALNGYAT